MGRYSIDTPPIHWLCQEFIQIEHPPMSANILIVMLLVAQKHIDQIPTGQLPAVVYWSTVGPVSVAS